jgi:DNA modification methylase
VFREVRRVLRPDGVLFLNLGDSYFGTGKGPTPPTGFHGVNGTPYPTKGLYTHDVLKQKDLIGIPWRVAFALQADGWYLRSDIIWAKPNPMPESVRDRPTKAHEYIFLLSKSPRYFWDTEAVKEVAQGRSNGNRTYKYDRLDGHETKQGFLAISDKEYHERNVRSVWTIATAPFSEAHFATFPPALAERCIKAGTSEKGACSACGAPWVRVIEPTEAYKETLARANDRGDWYARVGTNEKRDDGTKHGKLEGGIRPDYRTTGWQPSCGCDADIAPCVVLDPFGGAGTVSLVAERLGRDSIYIDLNPEYVAMARKRIVGGCPMFTEIGT